jgi:hypothetical protein
MILNNITQSEKAEIHSTVFGTEYLYRLVLIPEVALLPPDLKNLNRQQIAMLLGNFLLVTLDNNLDFGDSRCASLPECACFDELGANIVQA